MLVIRRKSGESILLGDRIEIRVMEVSSGKATIGIQAPPEMLILRKEIHLAQLENLAAARGVSPESIQSMVSRWRPATRQPNSKFRQLFR